MAKKKKYIPVITRGYSRKIPVEDVIYIEQINRKLIIVTELGTFASYEKLESVEALLDWRFQHALKKMIINIEKITVAQNHMIGFTNGDEIELGRENFIRIKQTYNAYLKNLIKRENNKEAYYLSQQMVNPDAKKKHEQPYVYKATKTGEDKETSVNVKSTRSINVEKLDKLEVAKGASLLRKEIVDNEEAREEARRIYIEKLKEAEKTTKKP